MGTNNFSMYRYTVQTDRKLYKIAKFILWMQQILSNPIINNYICIYRHLFHIMKMEKRIILSISK